MDITQSKKKIDTTSLCLVDKHHVYILVRNCKLPIFGLHLPPFQHDLWSINLQIHHF